MDKKRILIVEDETQMAEMLKIRLETNNYEVLLAYDGEEGLGKARSEKPDLIILDLMLPKMDGYKVCRALKSDKEYSHIPIIMLTARAQENEIKLGSETGADAYITKPFDPKEFIEKIRGCIRN